MFVFCKFGCIPTLLDEEYIWTNVVCMCVSKITLWKYHSSRTTRDVISTRLEYINSICSSSDFYLVVSDTNKKNNQQRRVCITKCDDSTFWRLLWQRLHLLLFESIILMIKASLKRLKLRPCMTLTSTFQNKLPVNPSK